ncbi:MAG: metallophosphoesterase family protein, partial [Deltaproteobacteria bacterium]
MSDRPEPTSVRVRRVLAALLLLASISSRPALAGTTTFVAGGSSWKYFDQGTDQGSAWRAPGFDDSTWSTGVAQLGYGDGDEATTVGFGPNSASKYVTTWFRKSFTATGVAGLVRLDLRLVRDDGAVVYLNGNEIARSNMPAGAIGSSTLASTAISGADESAWQSFSISPAALLEGTNVLAVEMHQSGGSSTDLSFDLKLFGSDASVLMTRGPYLQSGTPEAVTVRWRTDAATDSRIRWGTDVAHLEQVADDATSTTEHAVRVTGLTPGTTYFYSVGSTTNVLDGGDAETWFTTPPAVGTSQATRVWVIGDSGTANASARAVRDAYDAFTGVRGTDLWLMLGDNAYNSGTDAEYQAAVFDTYPEHLRHEVLWPTLGNHDGASADSGTQTWPYYEVFSLPTAAEAGGVASGTEAYYSFDWANVHFVCLDSQDSSRLPGSPMLTWLEDDLQATDQEWIVAFWHHPPYTKGSHDSDAESQLVEMRANALPILEAHGVDLVLS